MGLFTQAEVKKGKDSECGFVKYYDSEELSIMLLPTHSFSLVRVIRKEATFLCWKCEILLYYKGTVQPNGRYVIRVDHRC